MPNIPDQPVRDYVLPLGQIRPNTPGNGIELEKFLGTAFLIGDNGFLLTAAHVVRGIDVSELVVMKVDANNHWMAWFISEIELHTDHDIAIMKMTNIMGDSPLLIAYVDIRSASQYQMFGYPEDAMYELTNPETGLQHGRPNLAFYQGYVRRRIGFPIPYMKGDAFYELSEGASRGCSGSPVFQIQRNGTWNIIGVYLGIRKNNDDLIVSYALRIDSLMDWQPKILGRSFSKIHEI